MNGPGLFLVIVMLALIAFFLFLVGVELNDIRKELHEMNNRQKISTSHDKKGSTDAD